MRCHVVHAIGSLEREAFSNAVQLAALESGEEIWLVLDAAIVTPLGQAMPDELLSPPLQRQLDLLPEPDRRDLNAMPTDQLPIEPGGGLGRDLPVEAS